MNSNRIKLLIISFCSLLLGFVIYLVFNQQTPISAWVIEIYPKAYLSMPRNVFTKAITNFGADFLWLFSFTMLVQFILWLQKKQTQLLIICSLLGVLFELMQRFGFANGTADILDVVVYVLGCVVAIIMIQGGKLYEEK